MFLVHNNSKTRYVYKTMLRIGRVSDDGTPSVCRLDILKYVAYSCELFFKTHISVCLSVSLSLCLSLSLSPRALM